MKELMFRAPQLSTSFDVYLDNHPDYPRHSKWCDKKTDPAECDCRILEGLLA